MNPMTRFLTRFLTPAAVLLTVLAAGCASSHPGTSAPPAAPATTAPATTASATTAPATIAPATTASATIAPASTAPIATTAPASPVKSGPTGADTYLAIGQDVRGTRALKPSCATGCLLSGDSTAGLWHMTWLEWTGAEAVGTGTEDLLDCTPNCAAGKQYKVAVRVTFSQPVLVCVDGGQWFWSRASFVYPNGLPSVFTGDSAPVTPWDFASIKSQAATSCA